MPRKSKKNSAGTNSASSDSAIRTTDPRQVVPEKIDSLFYTYAKKSSGLIEPQGIESLCSDLGLDYTDVQILLLAWRMQAQNQGYFTLEEWRRGLQELKADTIQKLKNSLPDLEKTVQEPKSLEEFSAFAFQYCLTEERQKTVDIESVCALLELVLKRKFRSQVEYFVQYLKIQTEYKVLNLDQWKGLHRFCTEIRFPGLDNYDPDGAWPSILDDFVDWMKANKG